MIQENGMPTGAPIIYGEDFILKTWKLEWDDNGELMDVWTNKPRHIYRPEKVAICYPIGATDSSDPKQELYFGDLIETTWAGRVNLKFCGVIVWDNTKKQVFIQFHFGSMPFVYFKDHKKLGSRYTHPEILKKAGLEKS